MKMKFVIACLIGLILIATLVSAEFEVDRNSSFIKNDEPYLEGDLVQGIVRINLSAQDNAMFESSFEGGIKLLDLLEKEGYQLGSDYVCNPSDCQTGFFAKEHTRSERQGINLNNKKIYGFRIKETNRRINRIKDFKFNVSVNAPFWVENQLFIDLFNDGEIDYYNSKVFPYDNPYFGKNYGCFEPEKASGSVTIGNNLYCELIKDLPPAPGYRLGANLEGSGGSIGFAMYAKDDLREPLGVETLETSQGGDVSVLINYTSLENFDAFVCIWTSADDEGIYSIRVNDNEENTCGIFDPPREVSEDDLDIDYEIYARPLGYYELGEVSFDKNVYREITGRDLIRDLNDYLNNTYNNDCSGEFGCVIPFALWGYKKDSDQEIHSAKMIYEVSGRGDTPTEDIFEVGERPAEVTSNGYLTLKVEDMGFQVPSREGEYSFNLKLGGRRVIREDINVDIGFDFDINPRFALVGRETKFTAFSDTNFSKSFWDFGDGSDVVASTGKSAKHTFAEPGDYVVKVTLEKEGSGNRPAVNSSRRFRIVVGEAKKSANLTLKDYENRISKLESDFNNFPIWVQNDLKNTLRFDEMTSLVQDKRREYDSLENNNSASDEDYIQIINDLLGTVIPTSIYVSQHESAPFVAGYNNINPAHIKEISNSAEEIDNEELKSYIIGWMEQNYDGLVESDMISAESDFGSVELMRKYKVTLTQKAGASQENAYLIINYPKDSIIFPPSISAEETASGTYIEIDGSNPLREIEFAITEGTPPNAANLGVYISPSLSSFNINVKPLTQSCWYCDNEGYFNWTRFLIGMSILLVATLIVYIILQTWYKRYYEKHLFKNPNDLYNVINFIYNSRKAGFKDKEAKAKLKKQGWKGEQIWYAFRKLEGKRTGMWEIPLFKFLENKKVRKELEKKQGMPLDTRFIKRPNL